MFQRSHCNSTGKASRETNVRNIGRGREYVQLTGTFLVLISSMLGKLWLSPDVLVTHSPAENLVRLKEYDIHVPLTHSSSKKAR